MVPEPRSAYALQFFVLATSLLAIAAGLSLVLVTQFPAHHAHQANHFSRAFALSTGLLLSGSICVDGAVRAVRRERQWLFRNWLGLGLTAGVTFVAVQTYALTTLIRQQPPTEAETGAAAFVAVFATLHGMHFIIALLFLCYITVQAAADRYDHEYYWGVTVCAWFWHALAVVWIAILFVMLIARTFA
ncbi:cytochrome c oxidase subunit 3 [Schlesneria paludicola]|uniref:cytochrome c oxidase subunit 3 n=1 Tax=Schlesneria paludicola TaxID=360056 RepID=UPI00029B30AF|nr:cytochrome c oxidase subunit 3 [Schlesneria paludicola]